MISEAISENGLNVPSPEDSAIPGLLVLDELRRMVTSRHFRTSRRSKEFLEHVVKQTISGHGDLLKERLIGVQIFARKPDYAVGEDPVVRVLAGDVRHRIARYHSDPECSSDVLIDIPLGSYVPVFRWSKDLLPHGLSTEAFAKGSRADVEADDVPVLFADVREATQEAAPESQGQTERTGILASKLQERPIPPTIPEISTPAPETTWRRILSGRILSGRKLTVAAACLILPGLLVSLYLYGRPDPILRAFWLPASVSPKPVLLWLPKPMVYRPSGAIFESYQASHPNSAVTREARQNDYLSLDPADTIRWGDMVPVQDSGPGIGGVIAAVNMSRLLTEQGIRFEMRFGPEATYAEMRDSPAVIVGAINSSWAPQLTSEAHFAFDESIATPNIYETTGARRVWKMEVINGHKIRDYGLITRELSGKAGQFVVQVAGVSHFGTEAASEMLLQKAELVKIFHSGISLKNKNLQIVVSTDITDGRAGPPQVVAVSSW